MTRLYDHLLEETSRRCHPFAALFELTHACNTQCIHCYVACSRPPAFGGNSRIGRTTDELTTQEVFSILEQLAGEGVLFLAFSGGEPLLRRDFFEIALKARNLGFALRIFTNGTLIDEKTSGRIADLNPLEVEMSLHGARSPTHDRVTRVRGSFVRTLRGVENLVKKGVRVNLKTPLMKDNYHEYRDMKSLAERIGAFFFHDTQIVPRDDGDPCPLAFNMDGDILRDFYRGGELKFKRDDVNKKEDVNLPYCYAGRNTLAISPFGDIYPCVQIRRSAGNLKKSTFDAIWKSSKVLQRIRRISMENFEECSNCDLFSFCSHCPGVAFLETGRLLGCSPLARSQARILRESVQKSREDQYASCDA